MKKKNVSLFAGAALAVAVGVVACTGDPPLLGTYGATNCTACGANTCVDVRVDPGNCGACGRACAPSQVCSGGTCQASCAAPYSACGDRCADTTSDPNNCGGCGAKCTSGICAESKCWGGACAAGTADCDGNSANGCETALATSIEHCGGCDVRCAPPNASARCANAKCEVTACKEGFLDCDGTASNGCEINAAADPTHCGNCATTCAQGQVCVSGFCTVGLPSSFASPSIVGDLLNVPRSVSIKLAAAGSTTVYFTKDGTTPTTSSTSGASPLLIIPAQPEGVSNGASNVIRWFAQGETVPRLLVVTRNDSYASAFGAIVEDFKFANGSHVVATSPGTQLSGTASVQRWTPGNTRLQVIYTVDNTPVGCLFDANVGAYPGTFGTGNFSVTAPSAPGIHTVRTLTRSQADCSAAVALGVTNKELTDVGFIIVQ